MGKVIKVGYLGPPGTYSHQASKQQFEQYATEGFTVEYIAQPSIAACFQCVSSGECHYSAVPFENSSNGQVVLSYDLFRDWYINESQLTKKTNNQPLTDEDVPDFNVIAEQFVSIHHNFITYSKDIKKITKIYSHPQVWSQCNKFLNNNQLDHAGKIQKIDTSSTSKAVEMLTKLSESEKDATAAIASSTASEIHNVPILSSEIEDSSGNTTRFLILGKTGLPELDMNSSVVSEEVEDKRMSLICFVIKQNDDFGSLCDILQIFKQNNLNLQTITTRPSIISPWRYVFFVEVWENDFLSKAIDELEPYVLGLSVVGSFPRNRKFFQMIESSIK